MDLRCLSWACSCLPCSCYSFFFSFSFFLALVREHEPTVAISGAVVLFCHRTLCLCVFVFLSRRVLDGCLAVFSVVLLHFRKLHTSPLLINCSCMCFQPSQSLIFYFYAVHLKMIWKRLSACADRKSVV